MKNVNKGRQQKKARYPRPRYLDFFISASYLDEFTTYRTRRWRLRSTSGPGSPRR